MIPPRLVLDDGLKKIQTIAVSNAIYIPEYIMIDSKILSKPLRLQNFVIEPLSILLSVHTSMRLYVALDHSPLYFGTFERKNLLTTPYRLGNALTMHYLSGAIFGAGRSIFTHIHIYIYIYIYIYEILILYILI